MAVELLDAQKQGIRIGKTRQLIPGLSPFSALCTKMISDCKE
jgi:hypothetical protein